jgi:demethoxyubiquinone hydroxylase (CLK1/Coq7/Cat5 family)
MNRSNLSRETLSRILNFQRGEITEHHIYLKLASVVKNTDNAGVLRAIAADELRHYGFWKHHTGRDVKPSALRVFFFYWVSRVLGFTFGIGFAARHFIGIEA